MKRLMWLALALLLSSLGLAAPAFVGRAFNDCAPWDGAATRIVLPFGEGNQYSLAVYQSASALSGKTISFSRNNSRAGAAMRCKDDAACVQASQAVIHFEPFKLGQDIRGSFSLRFGAEWFKGEFRAVWNPKRALCG